MASRYLRRLSTTSRVDHATIIGIAASLAIVAAAVSIGGKLALFFDMGSFLLVIGGTICATLINFPLRDFQNTFAVLRPVIFPDQLSAGGRVRRILLLAQKARSDGRLSLQEEIYRESDPFLRKCMELLIDDVPLEDIRRIMELELALIEDRHRRGAELFAAMGTSAPAMGLIGTLIGLVQMLQQLGDPQAIGPAMALALLTTLYGALLAYLVCLPIAGKLRRRSEEEAQIKEMTIEGVISIAHGTNPRLIEQQLFGFLPSEERISQYG